MTRRRTPRAASAVLGGVGAGAVLAMAAPLAAPALTAAGSPDAQRPGGPVSDTQPLRAVGAAYATTAPAPAGDGAPVDGAALVRGALAAAPADPGSSARTALDALSAHEAATAASAAAATTAAAATAEAAPPARAAASPAGGAVAGLSGELARVVELTNAERAAAGCGALRADPRISAAAQGHSEDMAAQGYFAHDSRDGRDFADRITAAGYDSPGAENIAMGQPDAATVVQDWMESPGHRKNILNCSLTTIGVGLADGYWTQDFGR
ncbi:CAP domain-containing protein [Pseudonocardia sp. TMWB2A]|uniref:CAP domain-containing protein n=1 Tax=Pseudonocardia sp. TMWB2A TaxID=687430 RepID=UPI00307D2030